MVFCEGNWETEGWVWGYGWGVLGMGWEGCGDCGKEQGEL